MKEIAISDVGLIGLAVMGQNLALNMADHGFKVAVFNRTARVTKAFIGANPNTPGGLVGCESLSELVRAVKTPRKIVILVQAGPAVDIVTNQLIEAGVEKDDLIVDCGNSQWTDTIRRERDYSDRCRFFGSGVSGGEIGARFGPSLMPGGNAEAWKFLEPIWDAIAAKVDASTGKPIETAMPGRPVMGGVPCSAYIGETEPGTMSR
jgi:6-phosphogluconate dehydrogenase